MLSIEEIQVSVTALLKSLIQTPSFSGEENKTADLIGAFLERYGVKYTRVNNNIIARSKNWDPKQKTLLLNSHHDTVKVVNGWTKDAFGAEVEDGKLFGLGSNDAGASLVSLLGSFVYFYEPDLKINIIIAATAEEENFGPLGVKSILKTELRDVDFGIVGEPTNMEMAIAEKGLLVIDGEATGKAGHAARKEGENAIYKALIDIQKIEQFKFDKVSETLGENVISVTQVNAGIQHNVVPDRCTFVIDFRVNDEYTLEEGFDVVQGFCESKLKARSFNNNPSGIDKDHPLVQAGKDLGIRQFGSATLSDQAHMRFPTIKMGPGFSERSHTPDEFIKLEEIKGGVAGYIKFIEQLNNYF
ncbi:M20/M25/M40 family metallo-hydrolase [Portibacter lacus]|uniref:Acetylornithine deacetylase n=1 Tax=Portibacter lacus TaxID=1099794 RepID=A0AA37SRJ8_9BACT|nr:M20/M25/M40 family metallo-hydrolase [Portibacter lacus]GLR17541.1 acetylornithine deacetylase [Portibacter lacus]